MARQIQSHPTSCTALGVSGYDGTGKSTLTQQLGLRFASPAASIDEFGTAAAFRRSTAWDDVDRDRRVRHALAPLQAGCGRRSRCPSGPTTS